MKFYVLKLHPPRPTFVSDMSAEERALMQEHIVHWHEWIKQGHVVVIGPVLDPAGPYGMVVVRLKEDVEPGSLWRDDPVIKANRGFRFEAMPMLNALTPEMLAERPTA